MIIDRRDPERWEQHREQYERIVADYKAGIDTKAVFAARLYGIGMRSQELAAEIALHEPDAGPVPLAHTEPVKQLRKAAEDIEIGTITASAELERVLKNGRAA